MTVPARDLHVQGGDGAHPPPADPLQVDVEFARQFRHPQGDAVLHVLDHPVRVALIGRGPDAGRQQHVPRNAREAVKVRVTVGVGR
jgi:hypothetical protein